MIRKCTVTFCGGLLMGLTSAPVEAWIFAWLAFVPLWLVLSDSETDRFSLPSLQTRHCFIQIKDFLSRYRVPLSASLFWGFGYYGSTLFWITGIHPMTWMGIPWISSILIALFCWVWITVWGAAMPLLWAIGMITFNTAQHHFSRCWQFKLCRVVYGVSLWCFIEYIWSLGDLFWNPLALSQSPHNLVILQLLRWSGFTMVTASIVLVNGLLAESIASYFSRSSSSFRMMRGFAMAAAIACLGSHLLGFSLLNTTHTLTDQRPIQVGLIQGNIPNEIKLYSEGWRQAIARYTEGYRQLAQQPVDLVITPETALPFWIEEIMNRSAFYRALQTEQVPVLLGAFGREDDNFTNSLFMLSAQGKIISRYNKQKLVPLGEYIPFESILGKLIDRLSPLDAHLVRGQNPAVLQTPFGKATLAICYESAFQEHFRRQTAAGGQFIIVASNDAHYSAAMPAQHHALDVMQAIANDRWVARATNTGYSSIIAPDGQTIWLSKLNQYVTHAANIYARSTSTVYVRWGNWCAKLCGTIIVLIAALTALVHYQARHKVD